MDEAMPPWERMARAATCGPCSRGLPVVPGPFGGDSPGHDASSRNIEGWVACEYECPRGPIQPIAGRQLADLLRRAYELGATAAAAESVYAPGTRVWYEPSPGIRFAGVVVGVGSLPATAGVRLSAHYWRWKGRGRGRADVASAIAADCLTHRETYLPELREEASRA